MLQEQTACTLPFGLPAGCSGSGSEKTGARERALATVGLAWCPLNLEVVTLDLEKDALQPRIFHFVDVFVENSQKRFVVGDDLERRCSTEIVTTLLQCPVDGETFQHTSGVVLFSLSQRT